MAKKKNRLAEEIDLTAFTWITAGSSAETGKPGCGGCHPGGGGLEYDRDGFRYDVRLQRNPALSETLDGDYYQSEWDKTGVVEADCLLCHLPGYFFKERVKNLDLLNFRWAVVAGSGVGLVNGAVKAGETPTVVYNKRFFNSDGKIVLFLETEPESQNCLFCHGPADMIKRGFSWNDSNNHDIHNAREIKCTSCHPGNKEHNLAKGNENLSTVRDDLDGTMQSCKECHDSGYMGAPRPEHREIRPNHLDKLSCGVCHIPQLGRSSALGLDVSTGKVRLYPREGAEFVGAELSWMPEMSLGPNEKLYPVNAFQPNLFTNREADGKFMPLFSGEIRKAYEIVQTRVNQEFTAEPLVNTVSEITDMLRALAETLRNNPRFSHIHPCYHSEGSLYHMNAAGDLIIEDDTSWAAEPNNFNISHNVAPTQNALGSNGCSDCHTDREIIFSSWLAGRNETGIRKKSPLLVGDNSKVFYLSRLHKYNASKNYLIPLLFAAIFTLVLFRENKLEDRMMRRTEPFPASRMLPGVVLLLLVRNASFFFLAFTGLFFFFNNISIIDMFFSSPETAVRLHWSVGCIFVASVLGCIYTSKKIFRRSRSDFCHFGIPRGKFLIFLMTLTGAGMVFRNYIASDLLYICSLVHTLAAFVLLALYTAKIYYNLSRRLYFLHRSEH